MSRPKDNYDSSRWLKFKRWVGGEIDPLAHGMETVKPDPVFLEEEAKREAVRQEQEAKAAKEQKMQDLRLVLEKQELSQYQKFYRILSIILCLSISLVLLWTITYLPEIGDAGNPDNNEVSARYIEQGLKETGAVNIVTGMILDYRAFDTFGESCVLFIASCCVLVLLRIDQGREVAGRNQGREAAGTNQGRNNAGRNQGRDVAGTDPHSLENLKRLEAANDRLYEPKNDVILQKCSCVLVPLIFVFGVYIVLNGHLSPGGGFSGGAVLGSGLILYLNAFGFQKMEKVFNEKIYRRVTLSALTFYCLAKSYSFFTGANHLESGIPLGTPGAILSSGLILPLNICVGMVVACTMYAFYALFRKGGM